MQQEEDKKKAPAHKRKSTVHCMKPAKRRKVLSTVKKKGKRAADKLIASFTNDTIICFTDGSCLGNPGPCGAAAVLFPSMKEHPTVYTQRKAALGQGTNNVGELWGVSLALDLIQELKSTKPTVILTDSKYAIGMLTKEWKPSTNVELISYLKRRLEAFPSIKILWVAGHCGTQGNEQVDVLACAAMKESMAGTNARTVSERIVEFESTKPTVSIDKSS
jgi:ribonuclease HI